jgi:cell wall-associated NlpC family hydrolase
MLRPPMSLSSRFLLTATALGLLCAGPLRAAPDAPAGDAVVQLLQDKGLLPSVTQVAAQVEASPLVQQVRDTASDLVMQAMNFLGVPYRRGGNTADQGFDCSGFTRYVFENSIGLVLPRRADEQAKSSGLLNVKREELKPGDLVFFNTMRRAFSHVGIYVGEGKFIHAPRAGGEVRVEDMRQAYWSKRFNGARRADLPTPDTSVPTPRPQ